VILLDDLHWADAGSAPTAPLRRRSARPRARLFVGAHRDVEMRFGAESAVRASSRASASASRSRTRRERGRSVVRALLTSEPPAELADRIHTHEGNPFFVDALVRVLARSAMRPRRSSLRWRFPTACTT
jgi:hypothetical protein